MPMEICPNLLSRGACTSDPCNYRHDVHLCPDCRVVCTTEHALRAHLNGKKHRARTRAQACPHPSYCKVCRLHLSSGWNYPQHINGRAHRALLEAQGESGRIISAEDSNEPFYTPPGLVRCEICDSRIPSHLWTRHLTGIGHRKKERYGTIQAAFEEADRDKHGITLTVDGKSEIDFGFIETDSLSRKNVDVELRLSAPEKILLEEIRLASSKESRPRDSRSAFIVSKLNLFIHSRHYKVLLSRTPNCR